MNIFKDNADRYFECGLSIIPLWPRTKRPILEGWQRFSTELPTEEMIEEWKHKYPDANIGLVLGPASRVVALDADTDDPEILNSLPKSPVTKIGKRGYTGLFRGCADFDKSFDIKESAIQLLSTGRQTVLPPSIHPDTGKPFRWASDDLISCGVDDLPLLKMSDLSRLPSAPTAEIKSGRNQILKSMAVAGRTNGKDDLTVARELIEYDKKNHTPRLFLDASENFRGSTEAEAFSNALLFVSRITQSLIRSGISLNSSAVIQIDEDVRPVKKFEPQPLPSLPKDSFLAHFVDLSRFKSNVKNDRLALGAGLSLLSSICGNRFVLDNGTYEIYPNFYTVLIAGSGSGKSVSMDTVQDILFSIDENLIGPSNFGSAQGIISLLSSPNSYSKLAIIDEASKLLMSGTTGNAALDLIPEMLNTLWSKAGRVYLPEALKHGSQPPINHPFLSVLAGTTPERFSSLATKSAAESGFFARCMFFYQPIETKYERVIGTSGDYRAAMKILVQLLRDFIKANPLRQITKDGDLKETSFKYNPYVLALDRHGQERSYEYERKLYAQAYEYEYERAFAMRKSQQAQQTALMFAVSRLLIEPSGPRVVQESDLALAIYLMEFLNSEVGPLMGRISDVTQSDSIRSDILEILKSGDLSRRMLMRKVKLNIDPLNAILETLFEAGLIKFDRAFQKRGPIAISLTD